MLGPFGSIVSCHCLASDVKLLDFHAKLTDNAKLDKAVVNTLLMHTCRGCVINDTCLGLNDTDGEIEHWLIHQLHNVFFHVFCYCNITSFVQYINYYNY